MGVKESTPEWQMVNTTNSKLETFPIKCPSCHEIENFTHIDARRYECPSCRMVIVVENGFNDDEMAGPV